MCKTNYILFILIGLAACKEKYDSPVHSPDKGYLVIEGTVNSGPGQTIIRLTRTTKLGNKAYVFEKGAQVKIEGENNSSIILSEKTAGYYSGDNLNLPNNQKYRLRIKTAVGKEYLSDFVEVKKNPPIDTVSWKIENDGVQLYIQTHDDLNKTLYYQWEFKETWEFHSTYVSTLKYVTNFCSGRNCPTITAVYRNPLTYEYDSTIRKCWQTDTSTNLILGSTVKLDKDIVYLPLEYIPPKSWKLGVLYSIFVKQTTWTKEGFEFLEKMKKNTEVTGSVFDAQPSELQGNFRNTADATEPVIGFFNVCNIEQKRYWIKMTDLPNWDYRPNCPEIVVKNISDTIWTYAAGLLPTVPYEYGMTVNDIVKFGAAPPTCVDCTLLGSNVKPSFWP